MSAKILAAVILCAGSLTWATQSSIVSCVSAEGGAQANSTLNVLVDESSGQLSIELNRSSGKAAERYNVTCSNCASDNSASYLEYSGAGVRLTVLRTDASPGGWLKSYFESAAGNMRLSCKLIEN